MERRQRLHGRSDELTEMHELVRRVDQDSRGAALLLAGEAGIGKSALLDEVSADAYARGFEVVRLAGAATERDLAHAGLQRLLIHLGAPTSAGTGLASGTLAKIVQGQDLAALDPLAVASATVWLLTATAARRPLALLVDDIQWLDGATRRVVSLVARRLSHQRVLLVGALRTPDGAPGGELAVRWLAGLTKEASLEVVAERHPQLTAAQIGLVLTRARGNPLALVELPRAARAAEEPSAGAYPALTPRLVEAFGGLLDGLSLPTRLVLAAVAVDPSAPLQGCLDAASIVAGEPVPVDALQPAIVSSLVTVAMGMVRFHHPLVGPALLGSLAVSRRRRLHAAFASLCTDGSARQVWHRSRSSDDPHEALAAALEETARHSPLHEDALDRVWTLHRSAQLSEDPSERVRRLLLAAGTASSAGAPDAVRDLLREVTQGSATPGHLDHAALLRSWADGSIAPEPGAVSRLCRLAGQVGAAGDDELALDVLLAAAVCARQGTATPGEHSDLVHLAHRLVRDQTSPVLIGLLAVCAPMTYARRLHAELAERDGHLRFSPAEASVLGVGAHVLGDPVSSIALLTTAVSQLTQHGQAGRLRVPLSVLLTDAVVLGDWRAADSAAEALGRIDDADMGRWESVQALGSQTVLAMLRKDVRRAHDLLVQLRRSPVRGLPNSSVALVHGMALLVGGQASDAFVALRSAFLASDLTGDAGELYDAVPYLADAGRGSGQAADAVRVLQPLEELAELTPAPALHAGLRYARARLADDAHAEQRFHEALVPDLDRWPLMRARTQLAYGAWLRRQRRLSESRHPLLSAHATLEGIGATLWSDAARRELRASGLKDAQDSAVLDAHLSAQETQIARLAADGLSNREIGERLYLSPRTVGSHLYRIFPKLDITSRAQLAAHLSVL